MIPIAHGIDLVEVHRITELLDRHGERFLSRCFTDAEQAYAEESGKRRDERYAARFAAKEAVLKAIGTGWRDGIAWTDVEVIRYPSGQPAARLTGLAQQFAEDRGITSWLLSLSHTHTHAIASAIALGETGMGSSRETG
jgi:holo-[acyl-carrier protein] synthase